MSLWEYANPRRFMAITQVWLMPLFLLSAVLCGVGLTWGFFATPDDYRQGSTVKIIYIHVPAAMMAINAWLMMLVASIIWLVRRHHVSALAARAAAPIGALFTLIGLFTGAVWGQPMWGTWWEWDPRLTSFLVLFLFYLGYIALWNAIDDQDTAADLTSVLCMIGSVFALLSRYAIQFWSQGLHQGSSVARVAAITGADTEEKVSNVFFYPLLTCMIGFGVLFLALVLMRTRTGIMQRRLMVLEQRAMYHDA